LYNLSELFATEGAFAMKTLADLNLVLKNARDLADWIAHNQDGLEIKTMDGIVV
jgi:hypothetical protein